MIKTRITSVLTAVSVFLYCLSAACFVQAADSDSAADVQFEYSVEEIFFDLEFNEASELDLYSKYDTLKPEIKEIDGVTAAYFDGNRTKGRIGLQLPYDDEKALALKEALADGPVVFETKFKYTGSTVRQFFGPLFMIHGITAYFSEYENNLLSLPEDKWITFNVILDYSSGSVNVVSVFLDGVEKTISKTEKISNIDSIVCKNSMRIYQNAADATFAMDYFRVYKPSEADSKLDDSLIMKRFYSDKLSGFNSYDTFETEWISLMDSESGQFSDLCYTYGSDETINSVRADRHEHLDRLKGMAAEYALYGRELYKSTELLEKIKAGLAFYINSKFDFTGTTGNWSNALECPAVLGDIFILLKIAGYEPDEEWITGAKEHYFDLHTRKGFDDVDGKKCNNEYEFAMNTSNLPITCSLWKTLAVLFKDYSYIEKIYSSLSATITNHSDEDGNGIYGADIAEEAASGKSKIPENILGVNYFGDGFYPDGSYYGHGPLHYTFGYGQQYLSGILGFVKLAASTSWQFDEKELAVLSGILLDNMRWLVRGDNAEFSGIGRSLDSISTHSMRARLLSSCLKLLSEPDIPRKDELIQLSKDLSENSDINYVSGNKHFWLSDLMAHQRDNYSAFVKMSSTRTLKTEQVGTVGVNGYYMSTGTMPVMVTGREYEKAISVWDWDRLPGITAINKDEAVPVQTDLSHIPNRHYGSSSFVGGVSDGKYGAAAMDYSDNLKTKTDDEYKNPSPDVVSAKKSWFFFDDEIVALGTDVSSTDSEYDLLTNLNQSVLDGDVTYYDTAEKVLASEGDYSSENLKWVHHGNIGYILPKAQSAAVSNKTQYETGVAAENAAYSENIFSMYINHGKSVENGEYSYIILPNKTKAEVSAYYNLAPVKILRNDSEIQAVYHRKLEIVQAVFRTAASLEANGYTITVDKPCIAMIDFSSDDIKLYVQNPENTQTDITVTLKHGTENLTSALLSAKNGLYAGETISAIVAKPETTVKNSLYPVNKWYYQLEFNNPDIQGASAFPGYAEGTYPIVEKFDGEGVAAFDCERFSTTRCGFYIAKDDNYNNMVNTFKDGEELCFEFRTYFSGETKFYKQFFGTLFLNHYDGNVMYFDGYSNNVGELLTKQGVKEDKFYSAGWHTFSVVMYMKDGEVKFKNLIVDGLSVAEDSVVLSNRTTAEAIFDVNKTFVQPYDDKTAAMYLDYMRIYSVKAEPFTDSMGNKSESFENISKINLNKGILSEGSLVIAAFYDETGLLTGTNQFDIISEDLTGNIFSKMVTKPENAVDIRIFAFDGMETLKPLISPILFSEALNQ